MGTIMYNKQKGMKMILLSIEEAANAIKMNEETVRVWLREGKLKGYKVGACWRIDEKDLVDFITGKD